MQYSVSEIKKDECRTEIKKLMSNLKQFRLALGITAAEFADAAGIKADIYRLLENNGKGHINSLYLVLRLLDVLGVDVNLFLRGYEISITDELRSRIKEQFAGVRKTKKEKSLDLMKFEVLGA